MRSPDAIRAAAPDRAEVEGGAKITGEGITAQDTDPRKPTSALTAWRRARRAAKRAVEAEQ